MRLIEEDFEDTPTDEFPSQERITNHRLHSLPNPPLCRRVSV
jgi:hypothetical protein